MKVDHLKNVPTNPFYPKTHWMETNHHEDNKMPEELKSKEEFMTTLKLASVCYVKRAKGNIVKLKLRTKKRLYTFKTTPEEADRIVAGLNIEVIEA